MKLSELAAATNLSTEAYKLLYALIDSKMLTSSAKVS